MIKRDWPPHRYLGMIIMHLFVLSRAAVDAGQSLCLQNIEDLLFTVGFFFEGYSTYDNLLSKCL